MACLKVMEDGKRESSGNSLFERLTHEDAPPNRSAQAFGLLALSSHVRAQQVSTPSHISSLGLLFAALGSGSTPVSALWMRYDGHVS